MTFFDKLKAHVGGLVLIKTQLYWYKIGKWNDAERVHILLDALDPYADPYDEPEAMAGSTPARGLDLRVAVLLFIDDAPKWVWVYSGAVELIE